MVEDISERKLAERELQEAQKMEAVGRLVGGVAHDFNNLLTAITLYSDLLLASLETTSKQHRHGEEIRMAAERGATLIQQLLAFVRPHASHPEVLAVNTIVADMKNMLSRLIGEHIELITNTEDGLWPVKIDVAEIQQVILNLALNGRDAMPEGGRLHISLRNLGSQRVDSDVPPSNYLELCVQDTGSGMDADTRSHLFEPFFTTKPKGKGNGLGLVTVQRIVVQNRGVIRVDSELGRGTTVRVLLPAEVAPAEQNSEHENASENLAGHETVLLVEDEVAVRESIRSVLVGNGYNVIEARNGQEALNIGRDYSGTIDLLVTDIVLPGMGGREVALRLRHSRPQIRALYISGYSHEARMQLQGEEMVLAKPFTGDTLARKVREALNQEAHR
jgi:nitrogen-specific signal transduction histidine kinase/ActR/RegA family two-component response regulator